MSTAEPFVPAWKRLGLKLKNGSDSATIPSAESHGTADTVTTSKSKRTRTQDDHGAPPTKRARHETGATASNARTDHERIQSDGPIPQTITGRKKAVSFSNDTKIADTNADNTPDTNAKDSTVAHDPASKAAKPKRPKEKGKKKKDKKPQDAKGSNSSNGSNDDANNKPGYLHYLSQFQLDRTQWKFNKIKQIDLFKHLFDTELIASSYDPALALYLSGLQGANLRARLQEQAEAALGALKDEMATELGTTVSAADVSSFDARREALLRIRDQGGETETDVKDTERLIALNERVKIVLQALGVQEQVSAATTTGKPQQQLQQQPVADTKRKRKSRTAVVDDDSSDSDSSSSSSSSSSGSSSESESENESDNESESESESDDSSSSSDSSSSESGAETRKMKKRRTLGGK